MIVIIIRSESYLSLLKSAVIIKHDRSPGTHYQMYFKFILRNTRRSRFLADVNSGSRSPICYRRSVCLSSVVCLSVTLVHPTQPVEIFGNFFHHTIEQDSSFLMPKFVGGGHLRSKSPTPFQTAQFRQISAHSASTVIASEKSSISTYRKSTTRFPTSHR